MPVEINFVVDDARIVTALRNKGVVLVRLLASKMTALMILLQRKIVVEELSGQVLGHRTGRLASSVVAYPAEVIGNAIVGRVESSAGTAFYGKIHEFGGQRPYVILPKNAKALAFMMNGKQVFAKSVFHPPLPARPFMKPAQDQMRQQIVEGLAEATGEAMNAGS